VNGKVIFYADKITESMQRTIDETNCRREKQLAYNAAHGITPKQIVKYSVSLLGEKEKGVQSSDADSRAVTKSVSLVADPIVSYMSRAQLKKAIEQVKRQMEDAAKKRKFMEAAQYRDEMFRLQELLNRKE
jgi:excinuclease ABC subunit B